MRIVLTWALVFTLYNFAFGQLSTPLFFENFPDTILIENSEIENVPSLEKNNDKGESYRASLASTWANASLAYNFIDSDNPIDNFIGGGEIALGIFDISSDKFVMYMYGNLSKITDGTAEEAEQNISNLIQSAQGVSFGIQPIMNWEIENFAGNPAVVRAFMNTGIKINGYKELGINMNETVTLSQFRWELAVELEGIPLIGGENTQITAGYYNNSFSEEKYQTIFGETQSNLNGFKFDMIFSLAGGNFGVLLSYATSDLIDNIFTMGLVMRAKGNDPSSP